MSKNAIILDEPIVETKKISVHYLLTREFTNSNDFSIFIEKQAVKRKIGFMEALLEYCEEKDIDPAAIGNLISNSLKEKIRAEAEEMNLLKKSNKLPL
jgi:hypothetical protein